MKCQINARGIFVQQQSQVNAGRHAPSYSMPEDNLHITSISSSLHYSLSHHGFHLEIMPQQTPDHPSALHSQYISLKPAYLYIPLNPPRSQQRKYHNHSHLPLRLLVFRPPTAPPYARGSTVLYPLSRLSSLTLFFRRGGLCSSMTTTSSLPPRLRLRLLSRLSSLLSSTMMRSTLSGGLTIRIGLLSLLTSTVSDARRDLVEPPCRDFRCSRTTTDSVYEESEDTFPKFRQV